MTTITRMGFIPQDVINPEDVHACAARWTKKNRPKKEVESRMGAEEEEEAK